MVNHLVPVVCTVDLPLYDQAVRDRSGRVVGMTGCITFLHLRWGTSWLDPAPRFVASLEPPPADGNLCIVLIAERDGARYRRLPMPEPFHVPAEQMGAPPTLAPPEGLVRFVAGIEEQWERPRPHLEVVR